MNSVKSKLSELHADARGDYKRVGMGMIKSIFGPLQPADFKHAYLPITKEQGQFMQDLIIQNDFKNVVEFGTSFGISTIYLAEAVRQTGGRVITTELMENKAIKAMENINEVGLAEFVDLRVGDAMKTLEGYPEPIDFLFLDGWKDLYLPLFKMLEPQFHAGTQIYADNMDMGGTREYGRYIIDNKKYATKSVDDGKAFLSIKKEVKLAVV